MLSISLLASTSFCTRCFSRLESPAVAAGMLTCLNFASCAAMFSFGGSCLTHADCAKPWPDAVSIPRPITIAASLFIREITLVNHVDESVLLLRRYRAHQTSVVPAELPDHNSAEAALANVSDFLAD